VGAGDVSLKSVFICFAASPCTRLSRALSTISESDFALWHLPFSGMILIVRHTRSALHANQDHSGSPRSLDASLSERAVLTDPAAVSGHLALCGVPTGASQPLRCCRPAVKYLTRLNRFTFVTARASLCLRLVRFVTSQTQDSIPGEAAAPLIGAGISPAGSTRFILAHRSAGRYSREPVKSPNLADCLSSCPTICLPPSPPR
jgi:hypothetical protein